MNKNLIKTLKDCSPKIVKEAKKHEFCNVPYCALCYLKSNLLIEKHIKKMNKKPTVSAGSTIFLLIGWATLTTAFYAIKTGHTVFGGGLGCIGTLAFFMAFALIDNN